MAGISVGDIGAITSGFSSITQGIAATSAANGAAQSDFGSAAADLIGAQGDRLERDAYLKAQGFSQSNERIAASASALAKAQLDRQIFKAQGTTASDIASAGFAASGSALDLMREGASQGQIARQVTSGQGLINVQGYQAQGASYGTMSATAELAAQAAEANSVAATQAGKQQQSNAKTSEIGTAISAVGTIAVIGAVIF